MSAWFNATLKLCAPLMLGIFLITNVGCGGKPPGKPSGSATIKIIFDGQPVTEGMVSLQNNLGEGGGAPLNSEGIATLSTVIKGSYVVTVTPPMAGVAAPAPGTKLAAPKEYANIPAKFRRSDTSTLKAEVKDAKNEFKFDLKQ
ncbi:MAG: hypothetical protein V4719_20005 [Planctomycetota bacterium]